MRFTLEYQETDRGGSFRLRGQSFFYDYDAPESLLSIKHPENEENLLDIPLERKGIADPALFAAYTEKACQLKALMFSDNRTVDLTETLDPHKLRAIVKSAAALGRSAYALGMNEFERFARRMCRDCCLKELEIVTIPRRPAGENYYKACITTIHDNAVSARGTSLPGVMRALSQKTVCDLITKEFGHSFHGSAYNLLQVSSKLSSLGRILDENYIPQARLDRINEKMKQAKNTKKQ